MQLRPVLQSSRQPYFHCPACHASDTTTAAAARTAQHIEIVSCSVAATATDLPPVSVCRLAPLHGAYVVANSHSFETAVISRCDAVGRSPNALHYTSAAPASSLLLPWLLRPAVPVSQLSGSRSVLSLMFAKSYLYEPSLFAEICICARS